MTYIDKNLLTDEKVLFRTKKSLIIFATPLVILLFVCFTTPYMQENPILHRILWLPWVVCGVIWMAVWLEYQMSEYVVTNKRVMMREGFFYRHTNELRIMSISQVNIEQSLIGQMFNYGAILINAMGAYDAFSFIAKPNMFQRSVNEQLDKLSLHAD